MWRTILTGGRYRVAAAAAVATRGLGYDSNAALGIQNTFVPGILRLDPGDYTQPGLTTKLRILATLATNAAAPVATFAVGLYPVTGTAGASGGITYTIGAATASTSFVAPAANSLLSGSQIFDLPAAGFYLLAVSNSAITAASSDVQVSAQLQMAHA